MTCLHMAVAGTSLPLVYDDIYEICRDKGNLITWCRTEGLLGDFGGLCSFCLEGTVYLRTDKSYSKDECVWRCSNKSCNKKTSIRQDSWFAKSHLTIDKIIKLTYYWVYKFPQQQVSHELRIDSGHTTVDWYNFCRDICIDILEKDNDQIGGPGKEVEIDESKFGKRKYHRGKRVDGVWVFGGIERDSKLCFMTTVSDRSAATLIPIIKKFIKPGTTILSDCWKAYSCLKDEGYLHLTVNHSVEFKSKETGACTNTIESSWNAVKKSLPKSGTQKQFYDSYLVEYCIRKKYLKDANDKFKTFIQLIKRVNTLKPRKQMQTIKLSQSMEF